MLFGYHMFVWAACLYNGLAPLPLTLDEQLPLAVLAF